MKPRWLAVVALVGCGAKPAEPLAVPTPLTPNELRLAQQLRAPLKPSTASNDGPGLSLPRPSVETALEPPDVSELGRWPLTVAEHPALEPHFDVASALADLSPQASSNPSRSRGRQAEGLERLRELGKLTPEEIKTWRTRLEAALALAQHLWKLDPSACSKYVATLPPVQP